MQQWLAITVLVNYLAVLLSVNSLWQQPLPSAEKPYVHAAHCQENNYLLLDCWDKCNGDKTWQQNSENDPCNNAALLMAGLDLHFSPAPFALKLVPFFKFSSPSFSSNSTSCFSGFSRRVFPPPKLG